MTVGDSSYGFYKPALITTTGTAITCPGGLPTTVTLDRAPEIRVGGPRVNGAFTLAPDGMQFGGEGAMLRVEFSEDDVTSYPGKSYTDFRAVRMTYRPDYPANKEAASVARLSDNTAVPIRIENGRQIYAITLPIREIGSTYGAVPASFAAPLVDLSLSKRSLPDTVLQGQDILYSVSVLNRSETNFGPAAHNVMITDDLPPQVDYSFAWSSQGSVTYAGGMVTANLGTLNAGSVASLSIMANARESGTAENIAFVSEDETDPLPSDNLASATTTIVGINDLAIVKTATTAPVYVGGTITYRLTVTNLETSVFHRADDVVVTDTLPAGVLFSSASASQGAVSHTNGVVIARLGSLTAGASATIDIQVTAAAVGTVINTATAGSNGQDPVSTNDSSSAQTTVLPAVDLAITKIATPASAFPGDTINYQLTVSNPDLGYGIAATSVVVTDTLPAGIEFIAASASQGTVTHAGGIVTAQLGALAAGASATIDIQARAATVGDVTNTATVSANETDPIPGNNSASASTTVLPVVDLKVTKTASPDSVGEEGELRYEIDVSNMGGPLGLPIPATGIVLTDTLPDGVEYLSATSSQGSVSFTSPTLTVSIGTLVSGAHASVQIIVVAARSGIVENVASATCAEPDFDMSNNEARVTTTIGPASGPDLTGSWSGIRETCRTTRRGMTCTIQGTLDVANIGNVLAGRSSVTFYLNSVPALVPGATPLKTQLLPQLRPGQHTRASVRVSLSAGQRAAGRYLVAFVDSGNAVDEARERNNVIVFGPVY